MHNVSREAESEASDLYTARTAFITYIRPILEYNSVIWSPVEIFLINREDSQKTYLQFQPYLMKKDYSNLT